jgi:Permuted papain-like amidase enzyme, YaeF/YiiX, C92 family
MNKYLKIIINKRTMILIIFLIVFYLILAIPETSNTNFTLAGKKPFVWDMDQLWTTLEKDFKEARAMGCNQLKERINSSFKKIDTLITSLQESNRTPNDPIFTQLEREVFHLAPAIGACPDRLPEYIESCSRVRRWVKRQSLHWDMKSDAARSRIYRLLYGVRAAVEEVILQAPDGTAPDLVKVEGVPSRTPMASIFGVNIHSGDILVSRGGAPTSALISRGNDFPGNFSHIALVHVDSKTHTASIIEAHIEKGVAISSLEEYLKDKKLRVMVLRLRADLPELSRDLMLPHKAAQFARDNARMRHIPYDFQMNYKNPDKLFCSEVASAAYKKFGIELWMGISSISSPGMASWLAAFGVKYFETQEPSDLEYDPQLKVVAEWKDRETLYKDHMDNAVIDVMLEGAEKGDRLTYKWYLLPVSRVLKAYSVMVNLLGKVGPVPEGMSATAALKNIDFSKRHNRIKEHLQIKAEAFKNKHGYTPPYWELIKMAKGL